LDYGDPTLVADWTFAEGTGTIAYDYSGNNATGSWSGGQPYYSNSAKIGPYAGNFVGANEFTVANTSNRIFPTTGSPFSIVVWLNSPSFPTGGGTNSLTSILSMETYAVNGFRYAICDTGNGYGCTGSAPFFWSTEDGGGVYLEPSSPLLSTGQWYQLAVTYTGTTATVYVNGALVSSGGGSIIGSTSTIVIGFIGGYNDWLGSMDDFRIYKHALSAAQIAAMYNGGK
jgi:Concanavalin A-like lectin/glucanases superfamily